MTRRPLHRTTQALLLAAAVIVPLTGCTGGATEPVPTTVTASTTGSASAQPDVTPSATTTALVLREEGRIGDLPANAPEADVVAHLTDRFGVGPQTLDTEYACEPAGQPGRLLGWPGVRVLVLTTDPEGGATDPYVGGWSLVTEEGVDASLGTAEGLRLGDPEERIGELYPEATGSEWVSPGVWWWQTASYAGYSVVTEDVDGNGRTVGGIGSGFVCTAS